MSICNKFFFTKRGNITKVFKDNYKLFRDYELNCLLNDKRKFVYNLIFPNFIGRDFNEILDYICYFINNKDNLYYLNDENIANNLKYNNIILFKKKNFKYFVIYLSILTEKDINITEIIKKNFGDIIDEKRQIFFIYNFFLNNNLNYCKNSLRHLIYDNIYKEYKNTIFKKVKNFKELYYIIENSKQFKNKIKHIDKIAKILKKTIDTEIKSNLKELHEKKIDLFNEVSLCIKKIPNSISFYLQYLPEYFNKSYVKKELIKKLKENKIKYKL